MQSLRQGVEGKWYQKEGCGKAGVKQGRTKNEEWVTELFTSGSIRIQCYWGTSEKLCRKHLGIVQLKGRSLAFFNQLSFPTREGLTAILHLWAEPVRSWLSFWGYRRTPQAENQKETRAHMLMRDGGKNCPPGPSWKRRVEGISHDRRLCYLGSLSVNSLGKPCSAEDRVPHLPFASCVSFGNLRFPLNLNIFMVIIMVTIIKCSSK